MLDDCMIKPKISQYLLILFSFFKTTINPKATPLGLIFYFPFIFILAFYVLFRVFRCFASHSLRDRPCGTLIISTSDLCTCSGNKPIKFLAPLPGSEEALKARNNIRPTLDFPPSLSKPGNFRLMITFLRKKDFFFRRNSIMRRKSLFIFRFVFSFSF